MTPAGPAHQGRQHPIRGGGENVDSVSDVSEEKQNVKETKEREIEGRKGERSGPRS